MSFTPHCIHIRLIIVMVHELARLIAGLSGIFLGACEVFLSQRGLISRLVLLTTLSVVIFVQPYSNGAQACAMKAGVPRAPIATTSW